MANTQHKARLVEPLIGSMLARYIKFVYRTSWQTKAMTETLEQHYHNHPCIVAMWHGQFMLLPLIKPPFIPVDIMLARHRDAEVLAETLRHFDMQLIRGAGAGARARDRGGAHAFMAAVQALRDGRTVAMTADVPGGKARHAGPGIVMVARQSGCPILPVAIATSRYLAFNTWSRMTVNLPFAGLGFAVGPMVRVPREAAPAELETYREAVQASLNQATALAYARAGGDPTRATPRSALTTLAKPGLPIKAYRAATALARPATPLLLGLRERSGKEDHARRPERLGCASVARPPGRLAWFHAASVGETLAVLPLISALSAERPTLSFLLTTGTVTSAELARQRIGPRTIHQYAPLDVPRYVAGFLQHWKPDLAVFAESEIWPNLIMQSAAHGIPLALINARMTKRSFRRWRRMPGLAQPLFGRFALVLAHNESLAQRFSALGAPVTMSVGNLKVDAPAPPVDSAALERLRPAFAGRPLLMAASTHDGEDQVVAEAHRALAQSLPDLCTIIAPRHPERGAAITEMLKEKGLHVAQRSLGMLPDRTSQAYVADTIGELGTLYKLAPVAFIGGSLVNRGGQNPIEAVRQGAVVLTGPHWHNFGDAYDVLIRDRGAIVVHSADELASAARQLITNQTELGSMRQRADAALAKISGALPRTIAALLRYLPNEEGLVRAS